MYTFLMTFTQWLIDNGVIPVMVDAADPIRENKTYIMYLPDDVHNCVCVTQYDQTHNSLIYQEACLKYLQIIVRNTSHNEAITLADKIHKYLINRPEPIEFIGDRWVVINCTYGPQKMDNDAQGNYKYAIQFKVTTSS